MGTESSITIEGRKVSSPSVEWVLKQLSEGRKELSLIDLAEIRAGQLDQNKDGKRDKKDFYVEGGKQPQEVWKKGQVKWADFVSCSMYIDQLLSTPEQAMVVQRTDLSGFEGGEQGVLFISFAKDFQDANNLKTLDVPESTKKKPAEEVSRYIVRIIFLKDSHVTLQLIDRNSKPGEVYTTRSKVFKLSKTELEERGLKLDLQEGIKLNDQLTQFFWQMVTKEGPFKEEKKN